MIVLTPKVIKKIEGLLEKGYTLELRFEEGDMIPTEDGPKPRPPQVTIFKRPDDKNDIGFNPILINQDDRTQLNVLAIKLGEDPILIVSVVVPAGFNPAGLKGYGGISQEIPGGE